MRSSSVRVAVMVLGAFVALAAPSFGQSGEELPRFGAGAKFSTLGIGFEAATAVTERSNVRGGVNFYSYDRDFTRDGINYGAQLRMRSVEAHYDWFLGSFRVSPGLLVYNGNHVEGNASVPAGQSFSLGGHSYFSNPVNPVTGTAHVDFSQNKVAPMITAGFGNLLRRSGRRFTVTFEGGVAFESSPKAMLNLIGSACATPAGPCQSVAATPQIQDDIRAEENKINNGLPPYDVVKNVLKFYPVISVGVGYRFK